MNKFSIGLIVIFLLVSAGFCAIIQTQLEENAKLTAELEKVKDEKGAALAELYTVRAQAAQCSEQRENLQEWHDQAVPVLLQAIDFLHQCHRLPPFASASPPLRGEKVFPQ